MEFSLVGTPVTRAVQIEILVSPAGIYHDRSTADHWILFRPVYRSASATRGFYAAAKSEPPQSTSILVSSYSDEYRCDCIARQIAIIRREFAVIFFSLIFSREGGACARKRVSGK